MALAGAGSWRSCSPARIVAVPETWAGLYSQRNFSYQSRRTRQWGESWLVGPSCTLVLSAAADAVDVVEEAVAPVKHERLLALSQHEASADQSRLLKPLYSPNSACVDGVQGDSNPSFALEEVQMPVVANYSSMHCGHSIL